MPRRWKRTAPVPRKAFSYCQGQGAVVFLKLSAAWMLPSSLQGRIHGVFQKDDRPLPNNRSKRAIQDSCLKHLNRHGRSLAATDAKSCNALLFAVTLKSVHEGDKQARAGGADGVTLRAGAAVDVDFLGVQA